MRLEDIILLIVGSFNFILSLLVLIRSRNARNLYFFGVINILNLYFLFNSLIDLVGGREETILMSKLLFCTSSFLSLFVIFFITTFKNKEKNSFIPLKIIFSIVSIFFGVAALFTNSIVLDVNLNVFPVVVIKGNLYTPFNISIIIQVIAIVLISIYISRKVVDIEKLQFRYFIVGTLTTMFALISTNILLPILGINQFVRLPVVFSVIFTFMVTASILRHRLFSIRTITLQVIKIILLSVLFFTVVLCLRFFKETVIHVSLFSFEALFLDGIFAIIIATITPGFLEFANKKLASIIKPEIYFLSRLIDSIDKDAGNSLDEEKVKNSVLQILRENFTYSNVQISYGNNNIDNFKQSDLGKVIEFSNSKVSELKFAIKATSDISYNFYVKSNGEPYTKTEIDTLIELGQKLRDIYQKVEIYNQTKKFNDILNSTVTEQTRELKEKNTRLEETLRKERDMMDILGHELRTPLSIARNQLGFLELYLNQNADLKQLEREKIEPYILKSLENLRREIKILETILSSTKIENNRVEVNLTDIDCIELVKSSVEGFQEIASLKGLELKTEILKEKVFCKTDKERMQEILFNLIDNAIKYTQSGSVTVRLEKKGKNIIFSVIDTGEGIPKADIPNLGKKFFRSRMYLNKSSTGLSVVRPGGTGIGLFVVFGLAKVMKGKIEIESEEGKGSTFRFIIPEY